MEPEEKRAYVQHILSLGVLPGTDLFDVASPALLSPTLPEQVVVVTCDVIQLLKKEQVVDWLQLDRFRVHSEQGRSTGYKKYLEYFAVNLPHPEFSGAALAPIDPNPVKVIFSYDKVSHKRSVDDFVKYFTHRYRSLEKLLRLRPELEGVVSINKLKKKQIKEHVSIIGIVADRSKTKNGNIMLTLEDLTGRINVVVNKNKPDLFQEASDIVLDEVIGILGVCSDTIIFANNILWPDIPFHKELKKTPDEVYALFLSDIHVGSKNFLAKEFQRFLGWVSGKSGNEEQCRIASKVKYIFIAGDIVDGVGIYPDQDKELLIRDIYNQYQEFANLISQIPSSIRIILCAGNHDALRLSEPQPPLDKDFAAPLYQLPNVTIVSNPGLVNIHAHGDFPGIDVLLYHGYSFDYYVANVDSIRAGGGYHRADLIMKFLLKRRHIAPSHTSTLYIPDTETDPLVINHVPDIFVTGHIHYSMIANYRSVTMISGSCWQGLTSFQEKLGHEPEPARVPLINLQTRQPKIMKFT